MYPGKVLTYVTEEEILNGMCSQVPYVKVIRNGILVDS